MPRIAWINEFFQEFNPGERDHLRFKHVNDMPEKQKYHIFDLLLWVLKVDIYSYILNVLDKYRPEFVKNTELARYLKTVLKGANETWTKAARYIC